VTTRPRLLVRPRYLLWLLAPLLVLWALRSVSLSEAWAVLAALELDEILILVLVNGLVLLSLSGRWWLILRAQGFRISYLTLVGYRLAGFGVTYFTPGPQFGGEPLQVYLVQRRHLVPSGTAIAAVALDKSLELLGNFAFLAGGITCILYWQLFPGVVTGQAVVLPLTLLALPLGFLLAVWAGMHPISGLLRVMSSGFGVPSSELTQNSELRTQNSSQLTTHNSKLAAFQRVYQTIRESEDQTSRFCRQQPLIMAQGLGFALLSWIGMIGEYWLALHFLNLNVTLVQAIGALTAARLAYLLPVPAGLGALEASQVLALSAMGMNPSAGISLSLLIRARDVALAALGLWWGTALSQVRRT
jgi:uncharacterized protein (TIRG00374 family)